MPRKNATTGNYQNVEFRLGEVEHLPTGDNTVDAVISNCVINLSPSKLQVYQEAHRVLKRGGRFAVADIVALHVYQTISKMISPLIQDALPPGEPT